MRRKVLLVLLLAGGIFYTRAYCRKADLHYTYQGEISAATFKDFAERRRNFSLAVGVPDHKTERLVVKNPKNDGIAILYIHGFGASRAEGEATGDRLADELAANIYYLRLPGHGLDANAQAAVSFQQYLQTAEEALLMMPKLGRKTVVIGTSTGALVATYLGAAHGDKIHALILASPLWDFANKTTRILNFPGGFWLATKVMGTERDASWKEDPDKRQHPNYYNYWLRKQKMAALIPLNELRRFVVRDEIIEAIRPPTMTMFYYKDAKHLDDTIDVKKIRELFPRLGKKTGSGAKNKMVEIADGNHVLLSEFVRTDKERIHREILEWLESL